MDPNFFTTYVQPCLAPGVALIGAGTAAYIAWRFGSIQARLAEQQARTARNKLRLDLFERRLKVYQAVADYLTEVPTWAPGDSRLDEHLPKFAAVRWLFRDDVSNWVYAELLDEVRKYVMDRSALTNRPGELAVVALQATAGSMALQKQWQRLGEVFGPYLRLEDDPTVS